LKAAGYVALVGVCAFLYVVFAATSKPDMGGYTRFAEGPMAALSVLDDPPPQPTQTFQGPDGQAMSLAALRGDILVVNYWATFCAPCRVEMPTLAALQRRFEGRIKVVPISIDETAAAPRAAAMLAELSGGALAFHLDISRGVYLDSRSGYLPLTVIYDRQGVEIARLVGDADWSSDQANALIAAILADHPG
jgi:thiol-disulfide isomerase/thioredoxin